MRDKLECGFEVNPQARIDMLMFMQTTQARKWNTQEHVYIKLPKQWKSTEDAGTEEESRICKDDTRDCSRK